ncbi:hypothetical protein K443DRAFT_128192 [Laccaria amethystina LaAM-08-1]|uniref:FAR-17a/AIG1-like protein n=1 Tax=Laccaria amethystina LaAM-08-1 TaxID=1095629 RepID=A0A0C9X926_9AGAR|nr:hypothetical protein K443DRAFT_128192 [Laccaria amethystina LaAM-08-1]
MSRTLSRAFLNATAVGIMTHGFRSLGSLSHVEDWIRSQYGGHFQYLTIQGLILAWLTMLTGLTIEIFPSSSTLRSLKRHLFLIAMPLAVVISLVYWTLILLLPGLIVPSDDLRLPLFIDLALHASPASALLVDFLIFDTKYEERELKYRVPFAATVFAVWYGLWVEHCAKNNNGIFPYPFLTENPLEIRIVIYIVAALVAIMSFRLINSLHPTVIKQFKHDE